MQFLIALDQVLNTLIWIRGDGFGWADETLSARLFRLHLQDVLSEKWFGLVDKLFFWEQSHCHDSWMSEIERKQIAKHYLTPHN